MFRIIFVIIIYLTMSMSGIAQTFDIDKDLDRLDNIVSKAKWYYADKEKEIGKLKLQNTTSYGDQDLYTYLLSITDAYLKYDSDSALYYANQCHQIALSDKQAEEILDIELRLILIHIYRGEIDQAMHMLTQKGDIRKAPVPCQQLMAIISIELEGRYLGRKYPLFSKAFKLHSKKIWSKYGQYISKDNWLYYYYRNLYLGDVSKSTLQKLLQKARPNTIQAAMLNIALSKIYRQEKNQNAYAHYLIESAINDITSSNREAMSLLFLLKTPYIEQGSSRAAEYALLCTDNATSFHDGLRSLDIVKAHSIITRKYEEKMKRNEKYLVTGIILLFLTLIAIIILSYLMYLRAQNRKIMVDDMQRMNRSLHYSIDSERQLQEKLKINNRKLLEEIKKRNRNFIEVYRLITNYLGDIDEFKKGVYNLLITGQIEKAKTMLTSSGNLEKYLQNFYYQFDIAFLDSHPDFVMRFNALLKPEAQIKQPKPNILTVDLRIYALISMGITDSVSIATFLHFSVQTVYNYRSKIRKSAISPADFAEQIAQLYS